MPRKPKGPWFNTRLRAWFVQLNGRQVRLADGRQNKVEAEREFHRIMAEQGRATRVSPTLSLCALRDLFLDYVIRELAGSTYEFYNIKTNQFCQFTGIDTDVSEIRPHHVTSWVNSRTWEQATRHGAITAIKRMFSWAKEEGHVDENPLVDMKRPGMTEFEQTQTEEEAKAILAKIKDEDFRDFLTVLYLTGCRSSEVMRMEASHLSPDGRTAVFPGKTTKKTKRLRMIALTPEVATICQRRAVEFPEGSIFRNTDGKPWNRNAVRCRFRRLRKTKGFENATAKLFRHGYITDGLEKGVPIATLAELAGHKDTRMISRVYSKLYERREHLNSAALAVRPGEPTQPSGSCAEVEAHPAGPTQDTSLPSA